MNIKNIIFGISIFILTISVSIYGTKSLYKAPEYEEFCSDIRSPIIGEEGTKVCPAVCVPMYEINETGRECVLNECGSGCGPDGVNTFKILVQCEIALSGKNCWDLYEEEKEAYSKNVFLIALPLGILIIVAGAVLFGLEFVGAGLMAGGVGVVFWGVGGFWPFAENWFKFILSLTGLIVIVWFAYHWNRKLEKRLKREKKK